MKRILIAAALALAAGGQALAADLPPPVAPPPRAPATYVPVPAPVFTWTGIYLGINGGYAFGDSNWTRPPVWHPTGNFSTDGFLVGGTVGGNYQWGQFVLGIEGDGDWTNLNGTTFVTAAACGPGCETKSDWLATVRGRAGYAVDRDPVLRHGRRRFRQSSGCRGSLPFSSSTQIGWTAGAGVEVAFTPNLTGKVEYLYVDLGNQSCGAANCCVSGVGPATTVSLTENVVRAGINYKFW